MLKSLKGVTSTELLIVMIIIVILSVVIFVSMTASIQDAEESKIGELKDKASNALLRWVGGEVEEDKSKAASELDREMLIDIPEYTDEPAEEYGDSANTSYERRTSEGEEDQEAEEQDEEPATPKTDSKIERSEEIIDRTEKLMKLKERDRGIREIMPIPGGR